MSVRRHNLVRICATVVRAAGALAIHGTHHALDERLRLPGSFIPRIARRSSLERRDASRSHAEINHRDPGAGGRCLYLSRRSRTAERQPGHGVLCGGDLFGCGVGRHLCVLGVPDAIHASRRGSRRAWADVRLHAARLVDDRGDVVMVERIGAGRRCGDPATSRDHGAELHPRSRCRQHQRHRGSGPAAGYSAGLFAVREARRRRTCRISDGHFGIRHRGAASDADVRPARQSRTGSPGVRKTRVGIV